MTKKALFALILVLVSVISFSSKSLLAQEKEKQKTYEKVLIIIKNKSFSETKIYPKESIKNDKYGRYIVGPDNLRYYIDENGYQYHLQEVIQCAEGVKIDELTEKIASIGHIDRVRVSISKGSYSEYQYFPKNKIKQDSEGYYIQLQDETKYYLDNKKSIAFYEESPINYRYITAKLLSQQFPEEIQNKKIYFSFNSCDINKKDYQKLNEIAKILNHKPFNKILITGHTDSVGSQSINSKMSYKRAKNVMNYLVRKCSMKPNLFKVEGKGQDFPAESNTTLQGRNKNRRVEFTIIE